MILKRNSIVAYSLGVASIVGFVYFFSSLTPPHTIVLKDDGFHPRTLTVHQGETVTFISKRGKYFWPASDFHPTHALYPAFDPKQPIAPDASWSFTFTEPGVYPFHDHLAAFYFGIIKVTDAEGKVVDDCMTRGGQLQCWQNELFLTLAEKGVDATYAAVARLYQEEPSFASSCHSLAHNIGLASYQFYQGNKEFILSSKATSCAAGFYHGFMEGYIGATGDIKGAASVCDSVGERIGESSPDARLQCYHGIGHGAVETAVASTGSFGSEQGFIDSALALCEEAHTGKEERYRCASGVYNGIANFYINGAYGLSIEKQDPYLLCSRQKEAYKESCYGNMNSVAVWQNKDDLPGAMRTILQIPDEPYRAKALEYVVNLYATNHIGETVFTPVIDACRTLPKSYHRACISGYTQGLLEHGSPGIEYQHALQFCRTPELLESERDACYAEVLRNRSRWYGREQAQKICSEVSDEERTYCKDISP